MRILSYNVNGIRAAIKNGLIDWLAQNPVDILCLQEVKALVEQVDISVFESLGLRLIGWHAAEKKGYSGVAIFARQSADLVMEGFGVPFFDSEGRVIRADFGELTILNCYFPSGTSGELRQTAKMQFLHDFQHYVEQLKIERPHLIICGDYNIAHTPMDIHDPVRNKNTSGFLPEERGWMTQWLRSGFVDAFRYLNPEKIEYSWWTYRAGARANNKGWRIDYFSVSDSLKHKLIESKQYTEAVHSDHCPVLITLDHP